MQFGSDQYTSGKVSLLTNGVFGGIGKERARGGVDNKKARFPEGKRAEVGATDYDYCASCAIVEALSAWLSIRAWSRLPVKGAPKYGNGGVPIHRPRVLEAATVGRACVERSVPSM